jgi:hypothetical protein
MRTLPRVTRTEGHMAAEPPQPPSRAVPHRPTEPLDVTVRAVLATRPGVWMSTEEIWAAIREHDPYGAAALSDSTRGQELAAIAGVLNSLASPVGPVRLRPEADSPFPMARADETPAPPPIPTGTSMSEAFTVTQTVVENIGLYATVIGTLTGLVRQARRRGDEAPAQPTTFYLKDGTRLDLSAREEARRVVARRESRRGNATTRGSSKPWWRFWR